MKNRIYVAIAAWALALGFGMERLWTYSTTPGAGMATKSEWPGSSPLIPRDGQPVLVMFMHPHCPCSRASLEELRVVMERVRQRPTTWILFTRPHDMPAGWERTDSWELAHQIAGATVLVDEDSVEAKRFGAKTSGQVMLYDTRRHITFSGGITAGRGHLGGNDGERQVIALLNGRTVEHPGHPVFGCGLYQRDKT